MGETNLRYLYFNDLINVVCNIRPDSYKMHTSHFYNRYEIYYLFSGERYCFLNGQTFHIKAGDIVFISPYALGETIDIGTQIHKKLSISFEEEYLSSIPPDLKKVLFTPFFSDYTILRINDQNNDSINNLCEKIVSELIQKNIGFELNIYALIIELLIFCSRNTSASQSDNLMSDNPTYRNIAKIVEYINKNFSQNITLSQLSKKFFLSPSYLSRTFKQVAGYSLIEYLNLVRINEAKDRLRKTDETISQIAISTGFANVSTFNRIFKDIIKKTPSEYRKYANKVEF